MSTVRPGSEVLVEELVVLMVPDNDASKMDIVTFWDDSDDFSIW